MPPCPTSTGLWLALCAAACAGPQGPRAQPRATPVMLRSAAGRPGLAPRHPAGTARYVAFPRAPVPTGHQAQTSGTQVAQAAVALVAPSQRPGGAGNGLEVVRRAFARAGVAWPRGVVDPSGLYRVAAVDGLAFRGQAPAPGDLAFFHDTHDANGDGLRNDPLSFVAVVERVQPDGTVVLVGGTSRGVLRFRLNTAHPTARRHAGSGGVLNHYLRPAQGAQDHPATAAQLLAGYARLWTPAAPPALAVLTGPSGADGRGGVSW